MEGVACAYVCRCVHLCVHVWRPEVSFWDLPLLLLVSVYTASGTFFYCFWYFHLLPLVLFLLLLVSASITLHLTSSEVSYRTRASTLALLAGGQASRVCPPCTRGLDGHPSVTWVLGIQTQVLQLVQQNEPSPHPHFFTYTAKSFCHFWGWGACLKV